MSSIGAVSAGVSTPLQKTSVPQKNIASSVLSTKRDSDGDFDGTAPGQIDPKDFGKGANFNRKA